MEKILRGKYLVRKSKLENGTDVIQLTGVFLPQNFNIDEIKDNDEMWVSDIKVLTGGIRFTDPIGSVDAGSAEQFLEGNKQSPSDWKSKGSL